MGEDANDDEIVPMAKDLGDPELLTREMGIMVQPEDLDEPGATTVGVHADDE